MMHPEFTMFIAGERIEQLRNDAARRRVQPTAHPLDESAVQIRLCRVGDDPALERLAALDSKTLPPGRFVVAEVDGRLTAALPLAGGPPIRDPFVRTTHLIPLLELRAAQIGPLNRRTWGLLHLLPHRA